MRCQKLKRACPGYRDLSKVRFGGKSASRSGTNSPAYDQKYRAKSIDVAPSGPWQEGVGIQEEGPMGVSRMLDSMNSLKSASAPNNLASMHLRVLVDEAAQCFFLANFIMLPGTTIKMGHLNFIVPLLQAATTQSPLRSAFTAVSLAALAAQPNFRSLLPKAKLGYIQALKQINIGLADPQQAKGDHIMATTVLLTVYEVIDSKWAYSA